MKIKTLPDLAQSMGRLKTMIELEARTNADSLFGYSIKLAFINKEPSKKVIQMIVDQLQDDRKAVENCIPKDVIEGIEKYWPEVKPETNDLRHVNI